MNYLSNKIPEDFNNNLKQIFNFLSLSGKYNVIGSANLKSINYNSDYDLDEFYSGHSTNIYDKIYYLFREKFIQFKKNPNTFVIDFKCGELDNEPIRWNYYDITNGYKILSNNRKIFFQDCLKLKSTIKLDLIYLLNGTFIDINEIYYLHLNNTTNYKKSNSNKKNILESIKESYDEYLREKDYFKALKRCFSYKSLENPKKYKPQLLKLIDFFNSFTGKINKSKNDLELLHVLIENNFRKPKIEDIKNNLQIIKQFLSISNVSMEIDNICSSNSLKQMDSKIQKLRDILFSISNKNTLDFIHKNKNLII